MHFLREPHLKLSAGLFFKIVFYTELVLSYETTFSSCSWECNQELGLVEPLQKVLREDEQLPVTCVAGEI